MDNTVVYKVLHSNSLFENAVDIATQAVAEYLKLTL